MSLTIANFDQPTPVSPHAAPDILATTFGSGTKESGTKLFSDRYVQPLDFKIETPRLREILFRETPYKVVTQFQNEGSISQNHIEYSLPELLSYIKQELDKWNLSVEPPWLVGGGASYVMSALYFSDVDICFYLQKSEKLQQENDKLPKEKRIDELELVNNIITKFFQNKCANSSPNLTFLIKRLTINGFAYIGLGEVDLKFVSNKDMRVSISSSDGFHVPLQADCNFVCCKDGRTWCDQEAFEEGLRNLKQLRFILKNAESMFDYADPVLDLTWRLTHRMTQGFSIETTDKLSTAQLSDLVMQQLIETYPCNDAKAIGFFKQKFRNYLNSHYVGHQYGKEFHFLHLLSMINFSESTYKEERRLYSKYLAEEWLVRTDVQTRLNPLATLILANPSYTKDYLAIIQGLFLLELTHPTSFNLGCKISDNEQSARPYISMPVSPKVSFHLALDGSFSDVAVNFLRSWKKLEKYFCAGNLYLEIFSVLGNILGENSRLTPANRISSIEKLKEAFLNPYFTTILSKTSPNGSALKFYEFLKKEMSEDTKPFELTRCTINCRLQNCLGQISEKHSSIATSLRRLHQLNIPNAIPSTETIEEMITLCRNLQQQIATESNSTTIAIQDQLTIAIREIYTSILTLPEDTLTPILTDLLIEAVNADDRLFIQELVSNEAIPSSIIPHMILMADDLLENHAERAAHFLHLAQKKAKTADYDLLIAETCTELAKHALKTKSGLHLRSACEQLVTALHRKVSFTIDQFETMQQLGLQLINMPPESYEEGVEDSDYHDLGLKTLVTLENAAPKQIQESIAENLKKNLCVLLSQLTDHADKTEIFEKYFQAVAQLKISDATMLIAFVDISEKELYVLPDFQNTFDAPAPMPATAISSNASSTSGEVSVPQYSLTQDADDEAVDEIKTTPVPEDTSTSTTMESPLPAFQNTTVLQLMKDSKPKKELEWDERLETLRAILTICDPKASQLKIPNKNNLSTFIETALKIWNESKEPRQTQLNKAQMLFFYKTMVKLFLRAPSLSHLKTATAFLNEPSVRDNASIFLNVIDLSLKVVGSIDISDINNLLLVSNEINDLKAVVLKYFPQKKSRAISDKMIDLATKLFETEVISYSELVAFLLISFLQTQKDWTTQPPEEQAQKASKLVELFCKEFLLKSEWKTYATHVVNLAPQYFRGDLSKFLKTATIGIAKSLTEAISKISWTDKTPEKLHEYKIQLNTIFVWSVHLLSIGYSKDNPEIFCDLLLSSFKKAAATPSTEYSWCPILGGLLDAMSNYGLFPKIEDPKSKKDPSVAKRTNTRLLCESIYIQSLCESLDTANGQIAFERLKKLSLWINFESTFELTIFLRAVKDVHTFICLCLIKKPSPLGKEFSEWISKEIFNKTATKIISENFLELSRKLMNPTVFYLRGLQVVITTFKENYEDQKLMRNFTFFDFAKLFQLTSGISVDPKIIKINAQITERLKEIDCEQRTLIQLLAMLGTDDVVVKASNGDGLDRLQDFFFDFFMSLAKSNLMKYEIDKYKTTTKTSLKPDEVIQHIDTLHAVCPILSAVAKTTKKFETYYASSIDAFKKRIAEIHLIPEYRRHWQ